MKILDLFKRKQKPQSRIYKGAVISKTTASWISSTTSGDTEIKSSIKVLRQRSRQLTRDFDHAKAVVRAFKNNVIGTGFTFQSQIKNKAGKKLNSKLNDEIEKLWNDWRFKEHCHTRGVLNFADIERMIMGEVVEAGEVFVRKIYKKFGGSKVSLALEIIEAEYLDSDFNQDLKDGNTIRMGIERDEWGRAVAYHFYLKHPGDQFTGAGSDQRRVRIPASEVLHLFVPDRASSSRGVPWLSSGMVNMHHLAGYQEAEVIGARARASQMGFIESPDGELNFDDTYGPDRVTDFEPGVFKYLAPGEKVTVPNFNQPNSVFDAFTRSMLRSVATGAGLSYETITKDYSQSNYSSTRQAMIDERDFYRVLQDWMRENFHLPIYREFLAICLKSELISSGGYSLDELFAPKFIGRGFQWIDPAKEIQASKDAVSSGFKTQTEIIAEAGGDIEEVFAQRRREIDLAKQYGLSFDVASEPAPVDPKNNLENNPE